MERMRVPASVKQKFSMFNSSRSIQLKQFLLNQSQEDRELYQEYLRSLRLKTNLACGCWLASQTTFHIFIISKAEVGFLTIPFIAVPIIVTIEKIIKFEKIQAIFDDVDVNKKD